MSNTYDAKVIDEVFDVENDDAIRAGREVAQQEGLLVGISAGAALFAAAEIAKRKENKCSQGVCPPVLPFVLFYSANIR